MLETGDLPGLNAVLNTISACFLTVGYVMIRRRETARHRLCMLGAVTTSALFLTSYVIYHLEVGSRPFQGVGWIRPVYFTVLISHIVLAAAIVPMVGLTLWRALKGEFKTHRNIARWTLPCWLYVSVTGVVVYWMLYRMGY